MMMGNWSCKDKKAHFLSPEVTHLPHAHISLASMGHMALREHKWANKYHLIYIQEREDR